MADRLKKAAGVGFRNQSAYQATGWSGLLMLQWQCHQAQVASAIRLPPLSSIRHLLSYCPILSAGQNNTTARECHSGRAAFRPQTVQNARCAALQVVPSRARLLSCSPCGWALQRKTNPNCLMLQQHPVRRGTLDKDWLQQT